MRTHILFFSGLACARMVCAADGRPYSEHLPASATGSVQISNIAGSVTVNGWDKPEVDVDGELGTSVERVDVTHTADRIEIKVILPQNLNHVPDRSAEATLQVHVPVNSTVGVSTVSAPITVDGIRGASRLHSVSGDVHAGLAGAEEEAASVNGNVYVSGNPTVATVRVSTVNGTVFLTHGVGDISAHTVNGRLDLAVDAAKSSEVSSVNGEVDFRGHLLPDAHMKATTVNGRLIVHVSADAGFMYDIATFGGSVHTCFGAQNGSGPRSGQVGSNGAGHASVHLGTLRGDIELCDR
ncbi:MAG TPA: hypothetical protein VMB48_05525 [Steroidobacteraceae bacterium]|nr:hypothetical protein [Steroidobacteraceae bacterium]